MNASEFSKAKKLGFGLMRLPMTGEEIDIPAMEMMADEFLKKGFTYFDTAYTYYDGASECAFKQAVANRHPRDSYTLATKLPLWEVKDYSEFRGIFETQLERTGAGYFDYYLIHALTNESIVRAEELRAPDFMKEVKAQGLARHIGFSFHGTPEKLDEFLTAHPEFEFVQLQLNYGDWENPQVLSRRCHEVAVAHNMPIAVMEPIKGGSLSTLTPSVAKYLYDANPNYTPAAWALRFAASLENVFVVLSGMSSPTQMEENLELFDNLTPISDGEFELLMNARKLLDAIPIIPCSSCRYCTEKCPISMPIPSYFESYNSWQKFNFMPPVKRNYDIHASRSGVKASDCIGCGACAAMCPQHIDIPEMLKKVSELFDTQE